MHLNASYYLFLAAFMLFDLEFEFTAPNMMIETFKASGSWQLLDMRTLYS